MFLSHLSDTDIYNIIEPLIDNMLEGSTQIDHEKHVRDFTDRLKIIVTNENLSQQCADYQKQLGYFKHREQVALFRRKHSISATWRLFFTKSDDEFVLEAMFVQRGDQIQIEHCMIF